MQGTTGKEWLAALKKLVEVIGFGFSCPLVWSGLLSSPIVFITWLDFHTQLSPLGRDISRAVLGSQR